MGCHQKALDRLYGVLANAKTRNEQDQVLDRILDATTMATEWDADQWGFDPTRWMAEERAKMNSGPVRPFPFASGRYPGS